MRRRSRRLAWSGESGFALIETVAALVSSRSSRWPPSGLITVSLTTEGNSRQRVLAEQVAGSQIESIRQLPYTSVGLVNGNPGGTVVATKSISIGALSATETTQIRWVTDATPNAFTTKADYKRVTVTINRLSDGRQLTQQTTYVGPANQASYGGLNKAIAQVQVMDMGTNQPVSGVPVSLQTGPSAPQSDTTDGSGTVVVRCADARTRPAAGRRSTTSRSLPRRATAP